MFRKKDSVRDILGKNPAGLILEVVSGIFPELDGRIDSLSNLELGFYEKIAEAA